MQIIIFLVIGDSLGILSMSMGSTNDIKAEA